MPGRSTKYTPARVSDEIINKIQTLCTRVTEILEIENIARIDGFLTQQAKLSLLIPIPSLELRPQASSLGRQLRLI